MTSADLDELEKEELAEERRQLQRDAVGGSLWISIQTLISLPLAVVANVVVAHALGAASYGTLAIYIAIYSVAIIVLNAGISDATVQWIATHRARKETPELVAAIRRCSGYHIFIETPLVAILTAFLLRDAGTTAILVGSISAAAVMAIGTSTVVMSGAAMNALAARISIAVNLATQTSLILVAASSPQSGSVFAARVALGLLGPLIALIILPRTFQSAVLRPVFPRRWPEGFLGYAFRTCASGVVTTLVFSRSELFVFQAYDLPTEAGLFALGAGVAAIVTAPIDSLLGPLLPATTALLATTPERAASALLRGLRTSTLLAGLILAVAVPVVAPLLPVIYGDSFTEATGVFVVLAIVSCIQSVNHPVLAFLLASRRTDLLLRTSAVSLVVDLAIAAALIPVLGVAGAVIASTIAQLTVLAVMAYRIGRLLDAPIRAQLAAMGYFCDALVIAGLAFGAQALALAGGQPPIVQSAVSFVVALAAVAGGGRLRRSAGLTETDVAVITDGLPRRLRTLFVLLVRAFALERPALSTS